MTAWFVDMKGVGEIAKKETSLIKQNASCASKPVEKPASISANQQELALKEVESMTEITWQEKKTAT